MSTATPVVTPDDVPSLLARLEGRDGLLLGLDFDGTLAPIAEDPATPRITPACLSALARFGVAPSARVAVISGRSLADLRPRVGLTDLIYAGNHGLELAWTDGSVTHTLSVGDQEAIARTADRLRERLDGVPGVIVEDKGLTITVHVRHVPPPYLVAVRAAVTAVVADVGPGLTLGTGKEAIEIRPAVGWDKGAAVDAIEDEVGDGWATIYLGDDEADEAAFRAVRPDGLAVLVGRRAGTAASCRLEDQEAVAPFLHRLATERLDG